MKKSKIGSALIEAMIIVMIVSIWIIWVMKILTGSQRMVNEFEEKILAISIARDALEWFTNIRDTNWKSYSVDYKNCWNTFNYNVNCVSDDADLNWTDIPAWTYEIYQSDTDYRFYLWNWSTLDADVTNDYKIYIDDNWFYSQWNLNWVTWTYKDTIYRRELEISYLDSDLLPTIDTNSPYIKVKVIVKYRKNTIEYEVVLSNWMLMHSKL